LAKPARKLEISSWWNVDRKDGAEIAAQIFSTASFIDQDQRERRDKNLRCMRLYGNYDYSGMGPYSYTRSNSSPNLPENRVKYSVVTSCTDTLCSKISKMKPLPMFLTEGGNFSVQSRAKKLSKFIKGLFKENDVYGLHKSMFRDGLISDLGAVKHFIANGRICSERVLAGELMVDSADSLYGKPTHMYQAKFVHKQILSSMFPKHKGIIQMSAGSLADPNQGVTNSAIKDNESEYAVVIESWKLPDGEGKGGRHVISVEKGVLRDDDYERSYFPFTFSRWSAPVVGFYGQSLVDRLTGDHSAVLSSRVGF
jgi:hypothetical protein